MDIEHRNTARFEKDLLKRVLEFKPHLCFVFEAYHLKECVHTKRLNHVQPLFRAYLTESNRTPQNHFLLRAQKKTQTCGIGCMRFAQYYICECAQLANHVLRLVLKAKMSYPLMSYD